MLPLIRQVFLVSKRFLMSTKFNLNSLLLNAHGEHEKRKFNRKYINWTLNQDCLDTCCKLNCSSEICKSIKELSDKSAEITRAFLDECVCRRGCCWHESKLSSKALVSCFEFTATWGCRECGEVISGQWIDQRLPCSFKSGNCLCNVIFGWTFILENSNESGKRIVQSGNVSRNGGCEV